MMSGSEDEEFDPLKSASSEIGYGYRLLMDLMSDTYSQYNGPFMDPVDYEGLGLTDYPEVVKEPVWLRKMEEKFLENSYACLGEFVCDFRLMLVNCYRYNGVDSRMAKVAGHLETIFEQKIALLPKDMRSRCSLAVTLGDGPLVGQKQAAGGATQNDVDGNSALSGSSGDAPGLLPNARRRQANQRIFFGAGLHDAAPMLALARELFQAGHEQPPPAPAAQDASGGASTAPGAGQANGACSELDRRQAELVARLTALQRRREEARLLEEWPSFEEAWLRRPERLVLRHSLELMQVAQFLRLACPVLSLPLDEVTVAALEWAVLLPRQSRLLARIVNSLFTRSSSRSAQMKKPPLHYRQWEKKVRQRVSFWYRLSGNSVAAAAAAATLMGHMPGAEAAPAAAVATGPAGEALEPPVDAWEKVPAATRKFGVEVDFFRVMGWRNPLEIRRFHELSLYQRIHVLKALVDSCLWSQESMTGALDAANVDWGASREVVLGRDGDWQLLHWPAGLDVAGGLRVYRLRDPTLPAPEPRSTEDVLREEGWAPAPDPDPGPDPGPDPDADAKPPPPPPPAAAKEVPEHNNNDGAPPPPLNSDVEVVEDLDDYLDDSPSVEGELLIELSDTEDAENGPEGRKAAPAAAGGGPTVVDEAEDKNLAAASVEVKQEDANSTPGAAERLSPKTEPADDRRSTPEAAEKQNSTPATAERPTARPDADEQQPENGKSPLTDSETPGPAGDHNSTLDGSESDLQDSGNVKAEARDSSPPPSDVVQERNSLQQQDASWNDVKTEPPVSDGPEDRQSKEPGQTPPEAPKAERQSTPETPEEGKSPLPNGRAETPAWGGDDSDSADLSDEEDSDSQSIFEAIYAPAVTGPNPLLFELVAASGAELDRLLDTYREQLEGLDRPPDAALSTAAISGRTRRRRKAPAPPDPALERRRAELTALVAALEGVRKRWQEAAPVLAEVERATRLRVRKEFAGYDEAADNASVERTAAPDATQPPTTVSSQLVRFDSGDEEAETVRSSAAPSTLCGDSEEDSGAASRLSSARASPQPGPDRPPGPPVGPGATSDGEDGDEDFRSPCVARQQATPVAGVSTRRKHYALVNFHSARRQRRPRPTSDDGPAAKRRPGDAHADASGPSGHAVSPAPARKLPLPAQPAPRPLEPSLAVRPAPPPPPPPPPPPVAAPGPAPVLILQTAPVAPAPLLIQAPTACAQPTLLLLNPAAAPFTLVPANAPLVAASSHTYPSSTGCVTITTNKDGLVATSGLPPAPTAVPAMPTVPATTARLLPSPCASCNTGQALPMAKPTAYVSPQLQPAPSPVVTCPVAPAPAPAGKVTLFQISGQLFNKDAQPVTVDNGVVCTLPADSVDPSLLRTAATMIREEENRRAGEQGAAGTTEASSTSAAVNSVLTSSTTVQLVGSSETSVT